MRVADLELELFRYDVRVKTYEVVDGDQATWHERGEPVKQVTGPRVYMVPVETLAECQILWFLCPKCFAGQQHHVQVTIASRGVPDDIGTHNKKGEPTRWNLSGTGVHDLTLTPSILLEGGCDWHGFVTNGDAA